MSFTTLENPLSRLTVLPNAMNWRGGWSVSEQYYLNDVVISPNDGYSYILTITSLQGGVDPALNLADWTEIAPASAGGNITAIVAGVGISIDNTNPQIPVVNNTGVLTAVAGTGLTNVGTANDPEFDNNGVLLVAVAPASGLTQTGTAENPILSNTGILTLVASNGLVNIGTAQDPILENTRNTELYLIPSGGAFAAPGVYPINGVEFVEIGRFTIPVDAVPNSTALLYVTGWGVDNWDPSSALDVMEYNTYFARDLGVYGSRFFPDFGFTTPPGNTYGVPANIFQVPHFPANQSVLDYIQQPTWIALDNINPNEIIYAVARKAYPYISWDNPSITAPYLLYLKQ
jgi:hypothetical protein